MKTVQDIKHAIERLSSAELAQIEAWICKPGVREPAVAYGVPDMSSQEPFPSHLTRIPGVRGGNVIVKGTRIGVHDVIAYVLLGCSVEDIEQRLSDLSRAQIYECLAYYEDHKAEIERLALAQVSEPQP